MTNEEIKKQKYLETGSHHFTRRQGATISSFEFPGNFLIKITAQTAGFAAHVNRS